MSSNSIFNIAKNDYGQGGSLFLNPNGVGFADTINKSNQSIWDLYKTLRSLDWDEEEFDFSSCVRDFNTCHPDTYEAMIKTIAFQWEADSMASRIVPVVGCVVTDTTLFNAWSEVGTNENIHANTYSEIVRMSFPKPDLVMQEMLKMRQIDARLVTLHRVMGKFSEMAHLYAAGVIEASQELYDHCILFTIALLLLERIQFIDSFAITFGIAKTGVFMPIGTAVRKIAQDELDVHVEIDKAVIRHEMEHAGAKAAIERNRNVINTMFNEVMACEHAFIDYVLPVGSSLCGITNKSLKQWAMWNGEDVRSFIDLKFDSHFGDVPKKNPLSWMNDWLDISAIQRAPQEEDNEQYKLGIIQRTDAGKNYDDDF